jgi:hypothetical protein
MRQLIEPLRRVQLYNEHILEQQSQKLQLEMEINGLRTKTTRMVYLLYKSNHNNNFYFKKDITHYEPFKIDIV